MIDGLLQLSRLDSWAQPYKQVDLNQLVREILFDLEGQIQRSGAIVDVNDLPSIEADPLQMRQLFQNLVSNALKYQPPGRSPRVKIYYEQAQPGWIRILVQDNGIGFPMEAAERIFQPFQRAVGKTQYEGSGMGLAICRKITERHGGSISAQSIESQGATFVVTLPRNQARASERRDKRLNEN
jgi:signal transduction histidine kinase